MKQGGWKPGDSCVWSGKWAVLTYLMGQDRAIITFDDYGQQAIWLCELSSPRIEIGPLMDVRDQRGGAGARKKEGRDMNAINTEMIEVALDRIIANPWQPRTSSAPEYISELQESILAVGLLQEPLARRQNGSFQLAFGHSRVEAVRGLHERGDWGPTIRLKVADLANEDMAYVALTENRARKDLTPLEEVSAWAKVLREIPGVTIQSLADKVRVDRTTMSKNLAILDLPSSVLDLVDSGSMSVRAAREFLALRNGHHCHEDQIALALQDLSGESRWDSKPPDYRVKTVRTAIRGLAHGRHAYSWVEGLDAASRAWRPLFEPDGGEGGRPISFDVAAFKAEYSNEVHVLPLGDESGGAEWTCEVKAWASWSGRATREATKAAKEEGVAPASQAAQKVRLQESAEWWKAVKRDPVVQQVVGNRLRAMKSVKDLSPDDIAALGSRIELPNQNNIIQLPQTAQPEGINLGDYDRAPNPPMFDFSRCATCIDGAAWVVPYGDGRARLACSNKQDWLDKQSVGMQAWVTWKNAQAALDRDADLEAIERLSSIDPWDARALVCAMWSFLKDAPPVRPLSDPLAGGWEERTRYDYWPAAAENFAALTGLVLPALPANWDAKHTWAVAADKWFRIASDAFDWPLALACLMVWQARVTLGIGEDIWQTVARATVPGGS